MYTLNVKNKNFLSGLVLASSVIILSGCGSSSNATDTNNLNSNTNLDTNLDTSGLTDQKLRASLISGTSGNFSNALNAFSSVLSNSGALDDLTTFADNFSETSTESSTASAKSTSSGEDGTEDESTDDTINEALEIASFLVDKSSIVQNGNVYTLDPDEAEICNGPSITTEESTADDIAACQSLLSPVSIEMTVEAVVNDEITAATTVYKYDTSPITVVGITDTFAYNEFQLGGLHALLTRINTIAPDEEKIIIPTNMQGSLRIAFEAESENSVSVTVSIPTAISVTDSTVGNTVGNETQVSIAATDKLLRFSLDAATETVEAEVSLGALDISVTDTDDTGNSFPIQLALNAISGKVAINNNGDTLTLTGITADSVKFRVDNIDALALGLASLDAVFDSTQPKSFLSLGTALNFDLSLTNVRNIFDDEEAPTDSLAINVNATSGTTFTDASDNLIKVTDGTLDIALTVPEGAMDSSVPNGSCFDLSGENIPEAFDCPVGN